MYQPKRRAGVFHQLPLGLRVLEKIEKLLDKHMRTLGASKIAMSSISDADLWRKSGRLEGSIEDGGHELYGLLDRKKSGLMLSPTHEEEVTNLVRTFLASYRDLPIRLYQVSQKYRDELRPRAGLLRTKEFLMKDLYTFDLTKEDAMETYDQVRKTYDAFFKDIGIPFLVAEADSGNMGGKLSHEYHYESPMGEDTVWTCSNCNYVANDEVVHRIDPESRSASSKPVGVRIWRGLSKDNITNITILYPSKPQSETAGAVKDLDIGVLKGIYPDLDSSTDPKSVPQLRYHVVLKHPRIDDEALKKAIDSDPIFFRGATVIETEKDFLRLKDGDICPRCETGTLKSHTTIEVGHTFSLGTRYSEPFNLYSRVQHDKDHIEVNPVQMGCYGIGVTRLMGAIAYMCTRELYVNRKMLYGLAWPISISPFDVAVIADMKRNGSDAVRVYDSLSRFPAMNVPKLDVVLDDRDFDIPWKLTDADLRGYPIMVVVGRAMPEKVEIQCPHLNQVVYIPPKDALQTVHSMLHELQNGPQLRYDGTRGVLGIASRS
jgi:prolyl-tRNA synthetase